jgi:hypothetical protein
MVVEEFPELRAVLRHPLPRLEILVDQREREVLQVDQGDLSAGISGGLRGDAHEPLT